MNINILSDKMKACSYFHKVIFLLIGITLFSGISAFSQNQPKDTTSVDNLFQKARNLAFNKQRAEARAICRKILLTSPDYEDVRVLIGRTYEWDNKPDSARYELKKVIKKGYYEDAVSALIDVETWEDRPDTALFYADLALMHNPNNQDILLKKAKLLVKKGDEKGAVLVLNQILNVNPANKEARDLLDSLKAAKMSNRIDIGWANEYFDDKLGANWVRNWNIYTLGYSHRFPKVGNVFFKTNFGTMGGDKRVSKQFDIDAYTNGGFFKKEYMNLSYGYSPDDRYFPRHHVGFELYQSLPHAWEASIGARYLTFHGSPILRYFKDANNNIITDTVGGGSDIYIFTGSIGKYWKNYWFSLRPYVTPSRKYFNIANNFGQKVSFSLYLTGRYYFATSNDYLSLTVGAGRGTNFISSFMTNIEIDRSQSISAGYSHIFKKRWLFLASFGVYHDEYKTNPSKYRFELDSSLKLGYYF